MTARHWILTGVLAALGLAYVVFFTEWLRLAPIEIASQVRFAIQPPRFGRPPPKMSNQPGLLPQTGQLKQPAKDNPSGQRSQSGPLPQTNQIKLRAKDDQVVQRNQFELIGTDKGMIEQAPGGVANVTFSLDNWYYLTRIRVQDVPADGTAPQTLWHLVGKSRPVNSLLYGRDPEGMKPLLPGSVAEPLKAGVPYRLIVEAGRRRGTNNFSTRELPPTQ